MDVDPTLLAFAGVVFAGYAVQTVTGFGANLTCVTFGSLFLDLRLVLTLAIPISILQTSYIVIRHRDEVRWRMLFTRVLPIMGVGLGLGFALVTVLGESRWLKPAFGALIFVLATRELWLLYQRGKETEPAAITPLHPVVRVLTILGAGFVHGIYASGGPLLVYAVAKEESLTKGQIRSTLTTVWLTMNVTLAVAFATQGRYDPDTLASLAIVAPGIAVGILVGEWLHHRVDERRFRLAMYTLLLAASIALMLKA